MDQQTDGAAGYAVNAQYYAVIFPEQHRAAVAADLPRVVPPGAPVVEIGCGTGLFTVDLVECLEPGNELIAIEPSPVMRAAFTTRMIEHSRSGDVTLVPGDAVSATLPADLPPLGAVVLLHVLTHFAPADRNAVWDRYVDLLSPGGVVVVDPQWPQEPQDVPATVGTGRQLGRRRYDTESCATVPLEPDMLTWRVTYRTVQDEQLIAEDTVVFPSHVVSRRTIDAELSSRGLQAVDGLETLWAWRLSDRTATAPAG